MKIGDRVRVIKFGVCGTKSSLVGHVGTVTGEPDDDGLIEVALDDIKGMFGDWVLDIREVEVIETNTE